jgi:hypothetical protein
MQWYAMWFDNVDVGVVLPCPAVQLLEARQAGLACTVADGGAQSVVHV